MCGVYGFIGKPTAKTGRAIRTLGELNEDRGHDSTGLAIIDQDSLSFVKKALTASKFFKAPEVTRVLNLKGRKFVNIIGHTRAACVGAVNDKNAHPFRIGNILMAHNGVISNFQRLQDKFNTDYQVDSQIIGYLLNVKEPLEVFEKTLSGWFTVPYIEIDNPTKLTIVKEGAQLALAVLEDGSGVYYSSTKQDLKLALLHADIRCGVGETRGSKIYTFEFLDGKVKRDQEKIFNTCEEEDYYKPYYKPSSSYNAQDYHYSGKPYTFKQRTTEEIDQEARLNDYLDREERGEEIDPLELDALMEEIDSDIKNGYKKDKKTQLLLPVGQASGSTNYRLSDEELERWYEKLRSQGKLKKKYRNRPFESIKDMKVSRVVKGSKIPDCDCLGASIEGSHEEYCAFYKKVKEFGEKVEKRNSWGYINDKGVLRAVC